MKLHYIRQGKGEPLIVLHGLMGMLDNWKTPAKRLSERYEVFLVDQRNHGRSPHSATLSYAEMAEDLYELMDDLFLSEAHILGHSMGGKVAMKFAQHHPDMVQQLVVADIAPKAYPVHHHTILEALSAVPLAEIKARSEAEAILGQYIAEPGVRQFLLKNLYWVEKGVLAWRFNLDAIREHIVAMGEEVNDRIFEGDTLFVRGDKSEYILDSDYDSIRVTFPQATFATIESAGHWLHADQPTAFLDTVLDFLD